MLQMEAGYSEDYNVFQVADHSTKWSVIKLSPSHSIVASAACLSLFLLELAIIAYACTAKVSISINHMIFSVFTLLNTTFSVFYLIEHGIFRFLSY